MNKRLFLILSICLLSTCSLSAQFSKSNFSSALYTNNILQPGIKLGTYWDLSKQGIGQSTVTRSGLVLNPQVAYFIRPKFNQNFLLNVELGLAKRRSRTKGSTFSIISLGMAYWGQSQLNSQSINLGSGEIVSSDREWRNYWMPGASATWGRSISANLDWYTKVSGGVRFSSERSSSTNLGIELGLIFQ